MISITIPMNLYLIIALIVTWFIVSVISTYAIFFDGDGESFHKEKLPFKILVLIIVYSPGINHVLGVIIGGAALWKYVIHKSYVKCREKCVEYKERYKIYIERKQKIKLGIIRISPNDPYGEENWNE